MNDVNKSFIYFDYNATTPYDDEVCDVISKTMKLNWANPSCGYDIGCEAKSIISNGRQQIKLMINAANDDHIVFTSGGTEV
jgi:cysteine desulfurase